MADGSERRSDLEQGIYDPRRDANWQARLEEARAKRAVALRNKAKQGRPKKRLKPWEEEGAVVLDDDTDFTPEPSGLEFFDRVDAMRGHSTAKPQSNDDAPVKSAPPAPTTVEPPVEHPTRPGANWSPGAEQDELASSRPSVPVPDARRAESRPSERKRSVNDIFSDPVFEASAPPIKPRREGEESIPISALRVPPPEVRERDAAKTTAKVEPEVEAGIPVPSTETAKPKQKTSGLWAVAALFVCAIAVGPIYKMSQPIERGPLVFTLTSFPIEPALGLPAPMFEQPKPTRSREWRPASLVPTDEPLVLAKPNVPARARELANFEVVPAFGPVLSSILVGARIEALPETPANFALPAILPERPLGPSGQVAGLAEELNDLPRPSPRPLEAANG